MKKFLNTLLFGLLISAQAHALPPTKLSGQGDASSYPTFNFQVPEKQAVKLSDNTSLIDTGNDNVIANPGAEGTTPIWSEYADTAAVTPEDMTSGSNAALDCTRGTSTPLSGIAQYVMTISGGSSGQGSGCVWTVSIPRKWRGQVVEFTFPFGLSASTVDGDLIPYAYDVTGSALVAPISVTGKILGLAGYASSLFSIPDSATTMRFGIHIARTSTDALTLRLDDVKITKRTTAKGMAGSDWIAYTPTLNNATNASASGYWRRVGDSIEVKAVATYSGAGHASSFTISLPAGLNFDSSKGAGSTSRDAAGIANWYDDSVSGYNWLGARQVGTNAVGIGSTTAFLSSSSFAANDSVYVLFSGPIVGWSSNVNIGENSTFRISSILANGTRVTTTPALLGEYRSQLRSASSLGTYTDGAPATLPSSADGMRIWSNLGYAVADTNVTRYQIFVGKNKHVNLEWYSSTGRTGFLDPNFIQGSNFTVGIKYHYSPATGVLEVFQPAAAAATSAGGIGISGTTGGTPTNAYFDVIVSDNALAVGSSVPRCSMILHTSGSGAAGYGSTNVRVRRFTTAIEDGTCGDIVQSSTAGDLIQVMEPGIYTVDFKFSASDTGRLYGVFKNDTTFAGRAYPNHLCEVSTTGTSPHFSAACSATRQFSPGDLIRVLTSSDSVSTTNQLDSYQLTLTKVSP
jgi:hypothetical protein